MRTVESDVDPNGVDYDMDLEDLEDEEFIENELM